MSRKQKTCRLFSISFLIAALICVWIPSALAFTAEQEKMIAEAKIEGELNWIDTIVVPPSAKVIGEEFKKHYGLPDSFKINHQRMGTGPTSTRVAQEVQSGKVTIDVFAAAAPALFADLKKAGALMHYDSSQYANFQKARKSGLPNNPGYWQSFVAYCFAPITNPKIFKRKINSWYDLLAPDLKGQKIMLPNIKKGGSPLYTYYGLRQVLPKSYFEQLAQQQVIYDRGSSIDATQRLTQGEVVVTITNPFRIVQTAATTGVELEAHFPNKEGIVLLGQPYGILAKAPHPNAAKLFIDYLYSEEGTKTYIDLEKTITIRDNMAVREDIKKYSPPISELNVINIDWETLTEKELKEYQTEFGEIFNY